MRQRHGPSRFIMAAASAPDVVLKKDVAGAVHEGPASVTKYIEAKQHGSVQSAAGRRLSLRSGGAKEIFDAIAKQEFVSENLLVGSKDRLAGDKMSIGLGRGFPFIGVECRGCGGHSLSIGIWVWGD